MPDPEVGCCCCCCLGTQSVSDSLRPHVLQPAKLLRPWNSPCKNGYQVGSHFLLQGIFLTQGSNLSLLLGRRILYPWATREHPLKQTDGYSFVGLQSFSLMASSPGDLEVSPPDSCRDGVFHRSCWLFVSFTRC